MIITSRPISFQSQRQQNYAQGAGVKQLFWARVDEMFGASSGLISWATGINVCNRAQIVSSSALQNTLAEKLASPQASYAQGGIHVNLTPYIRQ